MAIDTNLGNVPSSVLDDSDNLIFAEGTNIRKETYGNIKADMLGSEILNTLSPKIKEAINELLQDVLDSGGYGIVTGGVVAAQSTPNMTVQISACVLRTATGARQSASANASLAITTANATNPRIDIVYISSAGVISYLQGTAAASPTAPSTPSGGSLLAEIYVAANATTITSANITDKRKMLISTEWISSQLSEKTNNTDATRTTTDKTVTGAINELNANKPNYETGTWTPILSSDGTGGSHTYTKQIGTYTKIGKIVHVEFWIECTKDVNMSGTDSFISGLPFVVSNTYIPGVAIGQLAGIDMTNVKQIFMIGRSNILDFRVINNSWQRSILAPSLINTNFVISGIATYKCV